MRAIWERKVTRNYRLVAWGDTISDRAGNPSVLSEFSRGSRNEILPKAEEFDPERNEPGRHWPPGLVGSRPRSGLAGRRSREPGRSGLEDRVQALGRLGFPELLESPGLQLPDTFPGEAEGLPDLLRGMLLFAGEPVAQP